jgi:predicted metal-dependent phosphotriesterase family hydrolase
MQVAQHDEATGGPIVAYMAPKMDNALNQIEQLTGLHVPLEKVSVASNCCTNDTTVHPTDLGNVYGATARLLVHAFCLHRNLAL